MVVNEANVCEDHFPVEIGNPSGNLPFLRVHVGKCIESARS